MVTGLLSAELSATCSNLGHFDGLTYHIDPYCRETLKDLIRYLRRDDDEHSIRRYLGSSKILQTDLLPILIHHSQNQELFDVVLRLLMNLTSPALIVYQEQIPTDKNERNHYLQIISHLQDYKQAFVKPEIWEVLVKKISELLEVEYIERDEDINRTMERILILARNVLAIPADSEYEKRPDNDATVHDKVLWAIHESNLAEIFLYIASSDKEQHVYMHILEIVSLMLREQKPSVLAASAIQRSFVEKEKDEEELLAFRQAEIRLKQMKVKKYAGARHGRFGGTFVMQGIKAAGDKDLIFHKPLEKAMSLDFNFEKKRIKKPKNLRPLNYFSEERRSTFGVRLYLKEFCIDFLNGAYNSLMKRVKEIIERGKSQGDESYFFWAMRFFMEFNRNHNFQVKLVSETVSIETFHFVQTQLEHWNDLMTTDKKKIPLWSRRMHLALNAYQELLLTLMEMDKSPDENVRVSSQILKSRVFYVTEYRDLLVILLHIFKENRFSRCYLKDLIETIHIFMKMLEKYCSKNRGLVVETKKKIMQRKKKSGKSKTQQNVNLESIWDQVGPQLSVVLQNNENIPTDIVPFDAASDIDMELQKVEAMKKIQGHLKNGDIEEAIGLLRAAREVWPENDSFGSATVTPEEEFTAMHEIFTADLGQPAAGGLIGGNRENEEEEEDEERSYETSQNAAIREQDFSFKDFVNRFVTNKTVEACGMLLSQFEKNSIHTNHCIVKLLHRIAWNHSMAAMLFQASIFRVFQRVLESRKAEYQELQKFAKFMVQKFIEVSQRNPKVFIELLFWKKAKEAAEIVEGYGSFAASKSHSVKNMWTEEQEDELRRLQEEFLRDKPGPNMVDWIMQNLINQDRTRRSVIKKLKELGLMSKEDPKRSARQWSEEEEQHLKELVQEFLEAENPIECIMLRIVGKRSKRNVVQKCIDLGLIADKKQLYKKRSRKSKKTILEEDNNSSRSCDDSNSSDEDERSDDALSNSDVRSRSPQQETQGKESKNIHKNSSIHSTFNVINKLIKCVERGYQESLKWLISSLLEVIEDLDEEEADVPLLPISQECIKAMEEDEFLDMLEAIGIKRPADEQEVYWRIPGSWKESDLQNKADIVRDAIDGKLVPPEKGEGISRKTSKLKPIKEAKTSVKQDTFKDILENIDRDNNSSNTDNGSSDDEEDMNVNRFNSSVAVLDSENSDLDSSSVNINSQSNSSINFKRKILSDSERMLRDAVSRPLKEIKNKKGKQKQRLISVFNSDTDSDDEVGEMLKKKSILQKENENHIIESDNEDKKENLSSNMNNLESYKIDEISKETATDKEISIRDDVILSADNTKKIKRKRIFTSDSSDDESSSPSNLIHDNSDEGISKSLKRKKCFILNSDSEDDAIPNETSVPKELDKINSTVNLHDEDIVAAESSQSKNILLHDNISDKSVSEDTSYVEDSITRKTKKRAVLMSDSEDDVE